MMEPRPRRLSILGVLPNMLTVGALCAMRMRPTSVLPVKLMWRTTSLAQSTLPTAML